MIKVKETIIVEGEHDKKKLASFLDAEILVTGGFQIFKDVEMKKLIKRITEKNGAVILTDSDRAGFIIRNHLKNIAPDVLHAYIPEIKGKERRKPTPGKEGILGVEGMTEEIIIDALKKSGVTIGSEKIEKKNKYTKLDLYKAGLFGTAESRIKRREFLKAHGLPEKLSSNMLLDVINLLDIKIPDA